MIRGPHALEAWLVTGVALVLLFTVDTREAMLAVVDGLCSLTGC